MTATKYKYPTHESISIEVHKIVKGNMDFHAEHNRESLDDLISDLIQYRNTLPTVNEYLIANEL